MAASSSATPTGAVYRADVAAVEAATGSKHPAIAATYTQRQSAPWTNKRSASSGGSDNHGNGRGTFDGPAPSVTAAAVITLADAAKSTTSTAVATRWAWGRS